MVIGSNVPKRLTWLPNNSSRQDALAAPTPILSTKARSSHAEGILEHAHDPSVRPGLRHRLVAPRATRTRPMASTSASALTAWGRMRWPAPIHVSFTNGLRYARVLGVSHWR